MRQPTQEYTMFTLEKWLRKDKHLSKNTSSNITTATTGSNVVIRNWNVSRRWGQHRSWPYLTCFVNGLPHGSCLEYTQESLRTPGVWPSKHRLCLRKITLGLSRKLVAPRPVRDIPRPWLLVPKKGHMVTCIAVPWQEKHKNHVFRYVHSRPVTRKTWKIMFFDAQRRQNRPKTPRKITEKSMHCYKVLAR